MWYFLYKYYHFTMNIVTGTLHVLTTKPNVLYTIRQKNAFVVIQVQFFNKGVLKILPTEIYTLVI